MADQNMAVEEERLEDVRVADASELYKFYLNQEKLILGTLSVALFLLAWELVGNVFQVINPMFMSAPSLIWKAALYNPGHKFLRDQSGQKLFLFLREM